MNDTISHISLIMFIRKLKSCILFDNCSMPLSEVCFKLWIYMGLLVGCVTSSRPRFDTSTDMGLVLVPADAEVDSVIFRLRATDQDANFPLTFDITGNQNFLSKFHRIIRFYHE